MIRLRDSIMAKYAIKDEETAWSSNATSGNSNA